MAAMRKFEVIMKAIHLDIIMSIISEVIISERKLRIMLLQLS
jgi:hypothetical protein